MRRPAYYTIGQKSSRDGARSQQNGCRCCSIFDNFEQGIEALFRTAEKNWNLLLSSSSGVLPFRGKKFKQDWFGNGTILMLILSVQLLFLNKDWKRIRYFYLKQGNSFSNYKNKITVVNGIPQNSHNCGPNCLHEIAPAKLPKKEF